MRSHLNDKIFELQRTSIIKIISRFSAAVLLVVHFSFAIAKHEPDFVNTAASFPSGLNCLLHSGTVSTPSPLSTAYIFDSLDLEHLGLSRAAFDYATRGFSRLQSNGQITNDRIITIIDFSKASSQKRLFIIDLNRCTLLCNTYVSHGVNTGLEYARNFSNAPESNQSSLGFYETGTTYIGKNGFSLKLIGLEKGFNDNAERRSIVLHAATYVNAGMARSCGYIGRSQGCPAVPVELHKKIIALIKGGTCLFIYSPDHNYLLHSRIING